MGILYLDEAGNTGIWDNEQHLLMYGGPYIEVDKWKPVSKGLLQLHDKYKSVISSRFQSEIVPSMHFIQLEEGVRFLTDFHFHARNIANRKGLWKKLSEAERFQVMADVIQLLARHHIVFYISVVDKKLLRPSKKKKKGKYKEMIEYRFALRNLFRMVEQDVDEHAQIVTFIDDGDAGEKEVIRQSLRHGARVKFMGELVAGKYEEYPLLQVADIGIWIFQAYHRLGKKRQDDHAKQVRALYEALGAIMKVNWYGKQVHKETFVEGQKKELKFV